MFLLRTAAASTFFAGSSKLADDKEHDNEPRDGERILSLVGFFLVSHVEAASKKPCLELLQWTIRERCPVRVEPKCRSNPSVFSCIVSLQKLQTFFQIRFPFKMLPRILEPATGQHRQNWRKNERKVTTKCGTKNEGKKEKSRTVP